MKMLEKMGFKQGDGLGKNADGIKEPVTIQLKYDKVGIGHAEAEKREREESEYERNIRMLRNELYYNMKKQQYDYHVRQKADRKHLMKDLRQAQDAIEMLDEESGKGRNPLLLSDDDRIVPPVNSLLFYEALKRNGVKASIHVFPTGDHGWGIKPEFKYIEQWQRYALDWLEQF